MKSNFAKATAITKALAITSILASTAAIAEAGQVDDIQARLASLEKENAAIRKENAQLIENTNRREQNARLKTAREPAIAVAGAGPASPPVPTPAKRSWFDAFGADLPLAYKTPVAEAPGQFSAWVEGGAIWSGGDPVSQNRNLADFTSPGIAGLLGGGFGGGINIFPYSTDLTPKVGWEAATGFDYRIAGSPWHVSGQFRYGAGGKTSGAATSAGAVDAATLALLGGSVTSLGGSQAFSTSYRETHWLADLAVGREVFGTGRGAMQLKGGLRVAEFVSTRNVSDDINVFATFNPPLVLPGLPPVSSVSVSSSGVTNTRMSFLGAGPLVGIQGSVPIAGNWAFDYLGDAAILFGTQRSVSNTLSTITSSPAFWSLLFPGGGGAGGASTATAERFASVFSADLQAGVSYWFTPNVRVGVSYRLDALINVQNQEEPAVANITPNRYTHGPRLTVTGQF